MVDLDTIIQAIELASKEPGFDLIQTMKDIAAIKKVVAAVKGAGKFDPAALRKAGIWLAAVDAVGRMAPLVAKLEDDPQIGPQLDAMVSGLLNP